MRKRDPVEIHYRLEILEHEGHICIPDCRTRESIEIRTEPGTYTLVVENPALSIVTMKSQHDSDFFDGIVCRFLGTIWDNVRITAWGEVPMGMRYCLFKNGYPVLELNERIIVLPRVGQIYLGGLPFFGT